MNYVEQEIVLHTTEYFGRSVPLSLSSSLLRNLQATTKPCVRMAFEGTSSSAGATPAWLERAIDIRTLGFSERNGETILHLRAPELGEAAPRLFEQESLFPGVATSSDTALGLVGKLIREVRREDLSSDLYDRSLLSKLGKWKGLLESDLSSLDFPLSRSNHSELVEFDSKVITSAQVLSDKTPAPRQVRVVGKLDMVRHSTRSFELLLATGSAVRGVLVDGMTDELQKHFGNDVTILGRAIYRPSGSLLRLDAAEILDTTAGRNAFSEIPLPFTTPRRVDRRLQTPKTGVSAFFGTWPGEETDAELMEALAGLRH
jgi:hypothetical protein